MENPKRKFEIYDQIEQTPEFLKREYNVSNYSGSNCNSCGGSSCQSCGGGCYGCPSSKTIIRESKSRLSEMTEKGH